MPSRGPRRANKLALGLVALRAAALALLVVLFINPPFGRPDPGPPVTALDVTASWLRAADSSAWLAAAARASSLGGDSVLLVGAAVSVGAPPPVPRDTAPGAFFSAMLRASFANRPLVLITDGEADMPRGSLQDGLPAGSRVDVISPRRGPDAALVALEVPPAGVGGDEMTARVRLVAGDSAPARAELVATVDGRIVATRTLAILQPWEVRAETLSFRLPAGGVVAPFALRLQAADDAEPRNDTVTRVIRRGERLTAVAVSTAPDFDFREIVGVLRSALSLPASARFRVAADRWVDEGGRPVAESQVRAEVARALLVVLHGDTAYFGAPRAAARGALALIPAVTDDREWYVTGARGSPIQHALAGIPLDALPPIARGQAPSTGEPLFTVRSGAAGDERAAATITDGDRRVAVVPVRGTARWVLRGGAPADAFRALWGGTFDWLGQRPSAGFELAPVRLPPRELHPQRPTLASGPIGEQRAAGRRAPFRSQVWVGVLVVMLLSAEWIIRRRAGLR